MSIKLCALASPTIVSAIGTRGNLHPDKMYGSGFGHEQKIRDQRQALGANLTEYNFTTRLDHFNNSNNETFPMRYLLDTTYYNETTAPILFYAGNEGGIYNFYNNTGFITETLAQKFGALVVFAEHRYYGTSMPFNSKTQAFQKENLKYLNVQQVMEDYVAFTDYLKNTQFPALKDRAVILFGGSYGGMLAGWMRIKYPHYFQGALASSAPVFWFKGKTDPNAYTQVASRVIKQMGGQQCFDLYK
jgi:lysosomal Pro-X carboxypeptidase